MINYDRVVKYWNKVFGETNKGPIKTASIGQNDLDSIRLALSHQIPYSFWLR